MVATSFGRSATPERRPRLSPTPPRPSPEGQGRTMRAAWPVVVFSSHAGLSRGSPSSGRETRHRVLSVQGEEARPPSSKHQR
jgi:hypothetical protein